MLFLLLLAKTVNFIENYFLYLVCDKGLVLSLGSKQIFLFFLNISALSEKNSVEHTSLYQTEYRVNTST